MTAIAAAVGPAALLAAGKAKAGSGSAFDFKEVEASVDQAHHVAEGYDADVLLRRGDPIFPDTPEFDPAAQAAAVQARQLGYNSDYVGYLPIDGSATHGLLAINHEYIVLLGRDEHEPPHHCHHRDGNHRACRRPRPHVNQRRSHGHQGAGDAQGRSRLVRARRASPGGRIDAFGATARR